jgi:hypothetical protein
LASTTGSGLDKIDEEDITAAGETIEPENGS